MDRVDYQEIVIQDIVNLYRREELNLNPWYQRRAVWSRPQKSYLLNTLFEQKPVPTIYVRHALDLEKEKSVKEVVDGQQRLRSVLEYHAGEFAARHPYHSRPVRFSELTTNERHTFLMTKLSIGYLIGATDSDVIEIFGRLNSVSKTLNLQEKRNANFSGEFKQFCLREAARRLPIWRTYNIFSANSIARMEEVQFVSELAINMLYGLRDYKTKEIDDTYKEFDDQFDQQNEIENRMDEIFRLIVSIDPAAIRDTIFSRAPLFFTLFLAIDNRRTTITAERLESVIFDIDKSYNSDIPVSDRSEEDATFYVACESNLHRIRSRRIRQDYVERRL